jgi:hypothetical protein
MPNIDAIKKAIQYLSDNDIPLPADLHLQLEAKGLLKSFKRDAAKQAESIDEANATYHDIITASLIDYFEGGGIGASRNEFKQATINAFSDMFDLGWIDGGQELPLEDDELSWLEARINQEFGFIDMLFQEAKELRKEDDFDYFNWITQRADGYTRMLAEIYNQAKLRAMDDQMVTFDGDDGEESCETCTSLKGVRHKISWFVKRNYVPPYGIGLQCARGGHCQHGLFDDEGNEITI